MLQLVKRNAAHVVLCKLIEESILNITRILFFMRWIWVIMIVTFVAYTSFALLTPGLSSDGSYWQFRNVEQILDSGKPLFDDSLAWGGRGIVFSPVFAYIMAVPAVLVGSMLAAKLMSGFVAAFLAFAVYATSVRLVKHEYSALLAAVISVISPGAVSFLFNQISPIGLAVPLLILSVGLVSDVKNEKILLAYIGCVATAALLHPLTMVFAAGLLLVPVLKIAEKDLPSRAQMEISLFSAFFVLWTEFILYKRILLLDGTSILQGVPHELFLGDSAPLTVLGVIFSVGLIPIVAAIIVCLRYFFGRLFTSLNIVISTLLVLSTTLVIGFVSQNGVFFLGALCCVLFAAGFARFVAFFPLTRLGHSTVLLVAIVVVLVISVGIPGLEAFSQSRSSFSPAEEDAFVWLATNTPPMSTIVALPIEGQRINALGLRKSALDLMFEGRSDSKTRALLVARVFSARTEIDVTSAMRELNADYVYVSPSARSLYGSLSRFQLFDCFHLVRDDVVQIFEKQESCRGVA